MKKSLYTIFQISAVFVGTIVGAGLASGQEITQFFTSFGYKSFIGIFICMFIYISISYIIINLSTSYNLSSYKQLIILVNSGFLGKITDLLTSFFMVSGAAIILAGSGALINQYFGLPAFVGIIIMSIITLIVLLRGTNGIIEINSIIVPSLLIVITTIFILFVSFSGNGITINHIKNIPYKKHYWLLSSVVYASFNTISFSGVLVPFTKDIKNKKHLFVGIILGALILTALCFMLNFMLIMNIPYIYKYDIPLLYIVHGFGKTIQVMLLVIIWLEMFSTEVSNIFSVSKTIEQSLNIPYKKAVIYILLLAIPISQVGFKQLITLLYPAFGVISFIFIIQCVIFYRKNSTKAL
ncbi:transporter [Clostridium akagii]|uniref:YkvI family membrane protein n=1 Tax=Clostridium akagii TaxID=91623 RepID=UPI00047BB501|nr:transporter [Clostridium akagii]